jgi:hypothetical protein
MTSGVGDKCYKLRALNLILLFWDQFKLPPLLKSSPTRNQVIALVPGYTFVAPPARHEASQSLLSRHFLSIHHMSAEKRFYGNLNHINTE